MAEPTYVKGQPVILSALAMDELGYPISNITLHFEDQTDGVYLGYDITNADGKASMIWDTSTASPGVHVIHVWNAEQKIWYVEESHAYLTLLIMAPAALSYHIQAPGAVRPRESFVVMITVENLGEASINDVVVVLGDQNYSLGSIEGGSRSQTSFNLIAPENAGEYAIQGMVYGKEEGTGRLLKESFLVKYRVKVEGFGVSISAPSNVEENEQFNFSVILNNLGEDSLKINLEVLLSGADPSSFFQVVDILPKESKTLGFSATAGKGDLITIIATGTAGDFQESDQVSITILHHPEPIYSPVPSIGPTPTAHPPLTDTPPQSTQNLSLTPLPFPSSPQENPEEPMKEPPTIPPSIIEEKHFLVGIIAFSILLLFTLVRKIWRVEEP